MSEEVANIETEPEEKSYEKTIKEIIELANKKIKLEKPNKINKPRKKKKYKFKD